MNTTRKKITELSASAAETTFFMTEHGRNLSNTLRNIVFDLRNFSSKENLDLLEKTIQCVFETKRCWLYTRAAIDDVIFNLNWLLARCKQDKEKVLNRMESDND